MTEKKPVITREFAEKELRFLNRADLRSTLILCLSLSLFLIPLTVGIICGICLSLEILWLKLVLSLPIAALFTFPIWLYLVVTVKCLQEKQQIDRGEFEIVTRTLSYKSEEQYTRNSRTVQRFFHFDGFERCHVNSRTSYELASEGDVFYLVRYLGKSTVRLYFSAKSYDRRES